MQWTRGMFLRLNQDVHWRFELFVVVEIQIKMHKASILLLNITNSKTTVAKYSKLNDTPLYHHHSNNI